MGVFSKFVGAASLNDANWILPAFSVQRNENKLFGIKDVLRHFAKVHQTFDALLRNVSKH